MEEIKHIQRRIYNWERQQLRKEERRPEVMNVSGWLVKRFTHAPKHKRKEQTGLNIQQPR